MYIVYRSQLGVETEVVNTWSNPTHAAVDLLDSLGQPYYTTSSTGPIRVNFKTPNNGGKWTINAGGELRVLGNWNGSNGLNTELALEDWGPCQGITGLGPQATISIDIDGDITGPVSAQSMTYPGILVTSLQAGGAVTLYANTGQSIAVADTIASNVTFSGNMTGNITVGNSITGTVRVYGSMSSRISAPSIPGTLDLADFTGTIEANGLTPETVPTNWSISPDCGWYVKDLTTGNVVQMPCAATGPFPAHGQQDVVTWPLLAWKPASNAVRHKLYFGTTDGSPTYIDDLTEGWYEPGRLPTDTTYYWRVDEVAEDDTVTTGSQWSFTTTASDPIIVRVDDNIASPQTPYGKAASV